MGFETIQKYFNFFVNSFFFIGPLLNTRQPQIRGQQNSQDLFNMIIYTDRFYRRFCLMKKAEFTLQLLTRWVF